MTKREIHNIALLRGSQPIQLISGTSFIAKIEALRKNKAVKTNESPRITTKSKLRIVR